MSELSLRRKALWCSMVLAAALCGAVYIWHAPTRAFLYGSVVGLLCMSLGVWLFFAAWRAAPVASRVLVLYTLRIAVVFGSVIAAMFVPFADALGVLLPQLVPTPVLAVLLLAPKPPQGGVE